MKFLHSHLIRFGISGNLGASNLLSEYLFAPKVLPLTKLGDWITALQEGHWKIWIGPNFIFSFKFKKRIFGLLKAFESTNSNNTTLSFSPKYRPPIQSIVPNRSLIGSKIGREGEPN